MLSQAPEHKSSQLWTSHSFHLFPLTFHAASQPQCAFALCFPGEGNWRSHQQKDTCMQGIYEHGLYLLGMIKSSYKLEQKWKQRRRDRDQIMRIFPISLW